LSLPLSKLLKQIKYTNYVDTEEMFLVWKLKNIDLGDILLKS
jgi:hypothetical protein